ncbi:MAG: tetratricopeptide repeat protein [Gemmatimonadetes bacterium]|nr:tetratricopeptide repeat protein [Gemmatimonadota bacterium]
MPAESLHHCIGSARRAVVIATLLCTPALAGCRRGEPALARGDRLWADSAYRAALAEYRLAERQRGAGEAVLARLAHAYSQTDQWDRAREVYQRLLSRAPEYSDQAIFDYITLAQRALRRGDVYGAAGATEAALELRPELEVAELLVPLARYYVQTGDARRATDFYQRALAQAAPDSVPDLLYEMAEVQRAQGNCREAVSYFEAFQQRAQGGFTAATPAAGRTRAGEARWHIGRCSFELAREARAGGQLGPALQYLDRVLQLGVPENLQDQAWFERGEILLTVGRPDEALVAFRKVLELNPARTGQLVERAQRRIDEIRFGP